MKIVPGLLPFGVLLVLASLSSARAFNFFPPPYKIDVTYSEGKDPDYDWQRVFAFRDSSGQDLIADVITKKLDHSGDMRTRIMVYNAGRSTLAQINRPYPVNYVEARDVNGDGSPELVLVNNGDSVSTVEIRAWPAESTLCVYRLDAKDFPERRRGIWNMDIHVGPLVPGVLENRPALLLSIKNGWGLVPRGLILIDPLKGTEIWHACIPEQAVMTNLMDVNSDSVPEIVVGCNAPANGATCDSLVDNMSYLVVLNLRGERLWIREFPGPFSTVLAFPLASKTGEPAALFTAFAASHPDAGRNRLMRVDARTGKILTSVDIPDTSLGCGVYAWGVDKQGRQTFVVSVEGGALFVYNEDLKLLSRTTLADGVSCLGDMNGDGVNELLGTKAGSEIVLFDHNLGLLATSSVKFIGQSVMQRRNNSKYAYIWGETTESICRLNIVRNPAYLPSVLKWTAMFLLLPASIILGYMVWVSRIRVVKFRAEADKARYEAWAAMASYMAHKTKTPLANIRLSSQNLQQELEVRYGELPQDLRHYFQTFTGDVDRAFKSLQSIIKFARAVPPRLEPTDLAAHLRSVVEQNPHPHGVTVELYLPSDGPLANLDSERIVTAVENIITNSYKAMKGCGKLTIRMGEEHDLHERDGKPDWLVIEIADTGTGIATTDLPHIFEPGFTTSEDGSGIGLVIVKKNIEDHGGTISIASELGKGTTVTVRLPAIPRTEHHEE